MNWTTPGTKSFREIWNANRDGPMKPVSGVESAKDTSAIVSKAFAESGSGVFVGRAEYVGTSGATPDVGQPVKIREIDSGKLTVTVE